MLGKILFFGGAVTSVGNLLLFSDRPTWADNVIVVTGMMCIGGFNLWVFAGALSTGSKKAKNGPLVIGVLDALKRGASVNDEPQIKFTVRFHTLPGPAQDSQEVTGSYKRVVSERTAQRLAPGDLVPVRYNLDNPRDFMIDFDAPDAARQRALAQRARGLTCEDVTVRTARLQEVRFLGPVTAHGLR
ncbi:MAG: DUF3592 domain-containing protein, partial [Micrococcales bacterium]|nr:DUF3592 domain-containing protein [Micrococcales bacterium]